jgi:Uma2 family endonuclease
MTATTSRLVTAEELFQMPDSNTRRELIRGVIHDRPLAGWRHARLASNGLFALNDHVYRRGVGEVVGPAGFLLERAPDTVLAPSFAFVAAGRWTPPPRYEDDFYFEGAPDLAGEAVSDAHSAADMPARVARWLDAGTRVVLVIDYDRATATVFRPGSQPDELGADDEMDLSDLVPGTNVPVRRLFER